MDFSYSESLCCPDASNHISAQSNSVREDTSLKEFQDGGLGCHFGYGLRQYFRNSESQYCPNSSYVVSAKIDSGSRGVVCVCAYGHLGYRNIRNLAILNFHVALMPHIKFQLNQTFGYVVDKNFSMVTHHGSQPPSWISGRNDFSISESSCCPNPIYEASAESNFLFRRSCRF